MPRVRTGGPWQSLPLAATINRSMLRAVSSILPRFDYRVDFAAGKDQGRQRATYEDVALVAPELALFAVADGMGGHQAGEVAAALAIEEVRTTLAGRTAQRAVEAYVTRADLESRREVFAQLRGAVERANQRVRAQALANEEQRGMGTTLDVVWLARDHAFVAHAGDGRVYLARARAMLQVTQDHTTAEIMRQEGHDASGYRAGITNAVGLSDVIAVDTAFLDLARGDRLLLCSDGVHSQIDSEAALAELLRAGGAKQATEALIARAAEGGRDNATAVVVEIGDRFVRRGDRDRGLDAADLERARQSPLLVDLPESFVLSALTAAVEVEIQAGERVPRAVASDLVAYVVLDGVVHYPTSGRRLGAGALVFSESLVGVSGSGEAPLAEQTTRLLRVRGDDFAEVCSDPRLAAQLYRRLAQHLARLSSRLS
jgi:serine/threonine protein phosphatase PrpC